MGGVREQCLKASVLILLFQGANREQIRSGGIPSTQGRIAAKGPDPLTKGKILLGSVMGWPGSEPR